MSRRFIFAALIAAVSCSALPPTYAAQAAPQRVDSIAYAVAQAASSQAASAPVETAAEVAPEAEVAAEATPEAAPERTKEVELPAHTAAFRYACYSKDNFEACAELAKDIRRADPIQARHLARRACDNDVLRGCVIEGKLEQRGIGQEADASKAHYLYDRACRAGEPRGCHLQGKMHERGEGTKRDPLLAEVLYRQACKGKVKAACRDLARVKSSN